MFTYSLSFDYFIRSRSSPSAELPVPITATSTDVVVTTFPRWLKHIVVQWSIPNTWGHCLFNVYFSSTEDSDFTKINTTPIDGSYFIDNSTQEYRKFNEGFYIVEVLPQDPNSVTGVVRSKPTTWTTKRVTFGDIRAREINRREYFLLTKYVGIKTYVFKKKTYGKRCPECWDYKAEKVMKDHCHTCFGTSFEGGYFASVPCYMQYEVNNNQERRSYTGIEEPNELGAWTIAFPEVHPDDILIRVGDWRAYRVQAITPTELQGKTVRQIFKLTEVGRETVEYELMEKHLEEYPEEYL